MNHRAARSFWRFYRQLAAAVRRLADKNFQTLKSNPAHPSLHLKNVGRFWSARVGRRYRALATEADDKLVWFWIGSHAEYNEIIRH